MTKTSPHTCLVEEVTPIFLGQYSTSTTRMMLVALGTCMSCSKNVWIETTFDGSTTTWSEHLMSSCTWSSMGLLLIVNTPMHYKLITSHGSMKSKLLSTRSYTLPSASKILP